MKARSKRQILMLHQQLVEQTGGSDGIRDDGLLDSALSAPSKFLQFSLLSGSPSKVYFKQLTGIPSTGSFPEY